MKPSRYITSSCLTRSFSLLLLAAFCACSTIRIDNPDISVKELNDHISFLASDSLKGRLPGTPEDRVAAEYILNQFADFGLQLFDSSGLQHYEVVTNMSIGPGNQLQIGDYKADVSEEYVPFAFSESTSLSASVVFSGYGFMIEQDNLSWNDFAGVDISGKWVMILRGDPEIDNLSSPYISYSKDRDKAMQAKDLGAGGVLLVSGPAFDQNDRLDDLEPRQSSTGIPVFQINRKIANKILHPAGETIEELEKKLINKRQPNSFELEMNIAGSSELVQESVQTFNVVAILKGSDPMYADEFIVIGAHYDHLGMGGPGSGSRLQDSTGIHYGADDNASGVAAMIEMAEKLASGRDSLKRSIIFVAFGAEEMGLLGSKYFVENSPVGLDQIKAMLNIDMIGRLTVERNLQIGGVGTSVEGKSILEAHSEGTPFSLAMLEEGYGPSDHASFYGVDIPVFFFSTGAHMDYHTPNDRVDSINFEGLKAISDYIHLVAGDITNREKALSFQEAGPKTGTQSRRRSGVTLGIMPDFAGNVMNGLRADFVVEGKPAYNGGMKKGDIITAINGLPVKNIQDYMYRLSKLKFGETINVEVKRGEKTELLLIQL